MRIAEQAADAADPQEGLTLFLEGVCALVAEDRGYADVHRTRIAGTPEIDASLRRMTALKSAILKRAKESGALRADVESADVVLLIWSVAAIADATRDAAPQAWRRHLALLSDALRPDAARPLAVAPLTGAQLRATESAG